MSTSHNNSSGFSWVGIGEGIAANALYGLPAYGIIIYRLWQNQKALEGEAPILSRHLGIIRAALENMKEVAEDDTFQKVLDSTEKNRLDSLIAFVAETTQANLKRLGLGEGKTARYRAKS